MDIREKGKYRSALITTFGYIWAQVTLGPESIEPVLEDTLVVEVKVTPLTIKAEGTSSSVSDSGLPRQFVWKKKMPDQPARLSRELTGIFMIHDGGEIVNPESASSIG